MLKKQCYIALLALITLSPLSSYGERPSPTISAPEASLGDGSLLVGSPLPFNQWNDEDHATAYHQLQAISTFWENTGRSSKFFVYGRHNFRSTNPFSWEIVPFYNASNRWARFSQQFSVLWNVVFGGEKLSEEERALITEFYAEALHNAAGEPLSDDQTEVKEDPFCNPDVIEKQWVYKGKKIQVLYNYAPVTCVGEHLHFMVVPIEHRENFRYLTEEEAVEAQKITQQLIKYFGATRKLEAVHMYHKNGGIDVGQTVLHWHQHLVFVRDTTDDMLGKLAVLKNIMLGPFPLTVEELSGKVSGFREEFKNLIVEETPPVDDEEEENFDEEAPPVDDDDDFFEILPIDEPVND